MAMGRIHSWESMGLVDGPGIRTVIFLQGCRLRCRYCHNPDTWELCGGGTLESPEETVNRLMRFKPYYGADGGVTFSGGEPLLQKEFLTEVLALCKSRGIHTCLDTAGVGCGGYGEILKNTDLVLLDVKHYTPEGYQAVTSRSMDAYEEFLDAVQSMEVPLWLRHVVVPGLTDGEDHLAGLAGSEVLESCVPVTRLTLAIRKKKCPVLVQLRIAKVNLVTGTQDSSTSAWYDSLC